MRATIFRGMGRHGARRYRRRNSPPIRDTSRIATQASPRAARSCRELPRDLVYAGEAAGGPEERLSRHGVSFPARAARVNPFWGIRKLGMKSWNFFCASMGFISAPDGRQNPRLAQKRDWPKCTDDLAKPKQPFCGMKNISAAIFTILKIKRCPRKPESWSTRCTHQLWVHTTSLICYSIPNFEHKNISLLVES